jgi:hypothetical protein
VAEQLSGVRSLLDWTLPRIAAPTGAEAPTAAPAPAIGSRPLPAFGPAGADGAAVEVAALGPLDVPDDPRPAVVIATAARADEVDDEIHDSAVHDGAIRDGRAHGSGVHGDGPESAVGAGRAAVPEARVAEQVRRPSPVARSGQRAGARR